METGEIVYFYCLILYRLSRIQYSLSLVSMLLKFVDGTSVFCQLSDWFIG